MHVPVVHSYMATGASSKKPELVIQLCFIKLFRLSVSMGECPSALMWLQRCLQPGLLAWSALYPWVTPLRDEALGSSSIEYEEHFQDSEILPYLVLDLEHALLQFDIFFIFQESKLNFHVKVSLFLLLPVFFLLNAFIVSGRYLCFPLST